MNSPHAHLPSPRVLAATGATAAAAAVELLASRHGRSLFLEADAVHLVSHLGIYVVLLLPSGHLRHEQREDRGAIGILVLVLAIAAFILAQALRALVRGDEPASPAVMTVSLVGLAANILAAGLFRSPARTDFSFRAAMAHEYSDAALTLAGLAGAGAIALFGWRWIDPSLSMAIAAWLAFWAGSLLARRRRLGPSIWDDVERLRADPAGASSIGARHPTP